MPRPINPFSHPRQRIFAAIRDRPRISRAPRSPPLGLRALTPEGPASDDDTRIAINSSSPSLKYESKPQTANVERHNFRTPSRIVVRILRIAPTVITTLAPSASYLSLPSFVKRLIDSDRLTRHLIEV